MRVERKQKVTASVYNGVNTLINVNDITTYADAEGINPLKLYVHMFGSFPNKLNFTSFSEKFEKKFNDYTINLNLDKFIKLVKEKYPNVKLNLNKHCDENLNLFSIYLTVLLEEQKTIGYVDTSSDTGLIVYCEDEDNGADLYKMYIKSITKTAPPEQRKQISLILTKPGGGYTLMDSDIKQVKVSIDKHYNDDFKKADKTIKEFIEEEDTSGLVILNGVKGTGKTTYIRHLINNTGRRFVYLTKEMASALTDPGFIAFLTEIKGCVLVIEDCENIVAARNQGNQSTGISNILNMCDGLLSDVFNIKIIATFNEDIRKVDSALLRKGRLIYRYEFKELCVEKANALFKALKIDCETDKPMTVADIFNFEKDNGSEEQEKKKIGFNV